MKFGIRLPINGPFASKKAIVQIAKLADEMGFDSVWTQGHMFWTRLQHETQVSVGSVEALSNSQKDPILFDSITTLSHLSALTSNVKLGFSVFVVPLMHPIVAA
ncbi:MAG: LLM class flavin-dependent oxidoreductase, partial [Nitrososphaerota archaeon]|nr:LLM class flavin-dependent oxidoreductase [Nitrososphaerota archaeon]